MSRIRKKKKKTLNICCASLMGSSPQPISYGHMGKEISGDFPHPKLNPSKPPNVCTNHT